VTTITVVDGAVGLTPDMLRTSAPFKPVRKPKKRQERARLYSGPMDGHYADIAGTHLAGLMYVTDKGFRQWRGYYRWDITEPDGVIIGVWVSDW